jgi:hypothetical protein
VESGQGEQEEGKGNGGAEEDGKPEAIEGGWVFFFCSCSRVRRREQRIFKVFVGGRRGSGWRFLFDDATGFPYLKGAEILIRLIFSF